MADLKRIQLTGTWEPVTRALKADDGSSARDDADG